MNKLQEKMLKIWEKAQNKSSKFYAQDKAEYIAYLQTRTADQLSVMINRQTEIANISEAAIRQNCQFGGLPKLRR